MPRRNWFRFSLVFVGSCAVFFVFWLLPLGATPSALAAVDAQGIWGGQFTILAVVFGLLPVILIGGALGFALEQTAPSPPAPVSAEPPQPGRGK